MALHVYISFCLPNSPPPLAPPPPPPPSSLPPSNRGPPPPPEVFPAEGVICHLNCSPWDVMTPLDLEQVLDNSQECEHKEELRGVNTMTMPETITRSESKSDHKKEKKKKKKIKGNASGEDTISQVEKEIIRKRRRSNGIVISENITVNKVDVTETKHDEKMKITEPEDTVEPGFRSNNEDRKKMTMTKKRRPTERNGASENAIRKRCGS